MALQPKQRLADKTYGTTGGRGMPCLRATHPAFGLEGNARSTDFFAGAEVVVDSYENADGWPETSGSSFVFSEPTMADSYENADGWPET